MSWIAEVRERLAAAEPRRWQAGDDDQRGAALVPLYVDAGELWVLLAWPRGESTTEPGQVAFPAAPLVAGSDPWKVARLAGASALGLEAAAILPLGELDEIPLLGGGSLVPCIGAVPFPFPAAGGKERTAETFALPVGVLAQPTLVEERTVAVDGQNQEVAVYHWGRHRLWGFTAVVLRDLLERLSAAP